MAKNYESDITCFLKDLKQKDPTLEARQRAGRALLWDKNTIDPELQNEFRSGRVPQQPYVYQTK